MFLLQRIPPRAWRIAIGTGLLGCGVIGWWWGHQIMQGSWPWGHLMRWGMVGLLNGGAWLVLPIPRGTAWVRPSRWTWIGPTTSTTGVLTLLGTTCGVGVCSVPLMMGIGGVPWLSIVGLGFLHWTPWIVRGSTLFALVLAGWHWRRVHRSMVR
ncbi:hypothetical protein [Sulfobacillus thermosulfidooxidans]|uniref:hypothetical protein n=1 Tax=Sulfobacillus thermosulfidooxidans TaxID=28034 RepID=UPI0006B5C1A0|nr:hypothetical protein [Sulfobacillus thermosulfidooxidans]